MGIETAVYSLPTRLPGENGDCPSPKPELWLRMGMFVIRHSDFMVHWCFVIGHFVHEWRVTPH